MNNKLHEHNFRERTGESMNCLQAETAMMEHMEQIIPAEDKLRLAQHVQECESCREYYLAFDEVMEYAASEEADWQEAPEGFAASVMTEIRKEAAYVQKVEPEVAVVAEIRRRYTVALHILWGFSVILLGVTLYFVYNPEQFANLASNSALLTSVSTAVAGAWASVSGLIDRVMQNPQTIENNLAVAALLFVLVLGSLLVVLHKEEGTA